jgi:hypothetical protein
MEPVQPPKESPLGLWGSLLSPDHQSFGSLLSPSRAHVPVSGAVRDLGLGILSAANQGAANDLGLFGASALLGHNNPPQPTLPYSWYYVIPRFTQFLANLAVTDKHREAGLKKFNNVIGSLNRRYYDNSSETLNGIVIGSWGKFNQIMPPRDVDALFLLPDHVYHRFQQRVGNRQSQLLQEVKDALSVTNPRTEMRADRHVVLVPFDAVTVEVAVGFRCTDGSIIVCDSKGLGTYPTSTALAEATELDASDRAWNGNTRALIRMIKCWQDNCNVPLKSFMIERLAQAFLFQWEHRLKGTFWYDWMVRDFFWLPAHAVERRLGRHAWW